MFSASIPPDFDLGDSQCNHPSPPRFHTIKSKKGVEKRKIENGKEKKEEKKRKEDNKRTAKVADYILTGIEFIPGQSL